MASSKDRHHTPVGGGVKKILYALNTIKRIGLLDSGKALSSNNTCKACGLGMGGQRGGMTDEQGEYPAVCNKSIQAQSTDIQPPIPNELFDFSLTDFQALTPHELEHLGRLGQPIYKSKDADHFSVVDWSWALDYAIGRLKPIEPARTFFYSSGRSSNEAGFVLQLLARLYGTNNVNNCSYYCHQATSIGLNSTIGTGTATVELADLDRADCIVVIGANPASNHPRFIHKLKACRDRGGYVIVINPAKEPGLLKFAVPKSPKSMLRGGSKIASHYLQPRIGTDIVLIKAIAKGIIEAGGENRAYIDRHTEGFPEFCEDLEAIQWAKVERDTGLTEAEIRPVSDALCTSSHAVFAWGMGVTHHAHGVDNVEAIAGLALLRGMVGKPGAGLLPLRGHSNVQGIGSIGVKPVIANDVFKAMQTELSIELPNQDQSAGMDTLACLEAAASGKIDAALLMGGNLLSATPHTQWAKAALARIGFKLYLTTTLNAGHVHACDDTDVLILPVVARDEEPEPTTQESMFNYIRMSDGGIQRIAEARSEVSILAELGQGIAGHKFDFAAFRWHQRIRAAIASIIPGMEQLADIDVAKKEFHIKNRLLHTPQFNTNNGKARFVVVDNPVQSDKRPFMLSSVRSEGQFNSIIYEEHDSYRDVEQRWSVLMNPADVDDLNIDGAKLVDIESDDGVMHKVLVKPFDIPRGNVLAYYPESNVLTGLTRDQRSQTPAFKSVNVTISAARQPDTILT